MRSSSIAFLPILRHLTNVEAAVVWNGLQPSIHPDRYERERLATSLLERYLQNITRSSVHSSFRSVAETFYSLMPVPSPPIRSTEQGDHQLWIRDEFLSRDRGHTSVPVPDIRSNRTDVDNDAFATGSLTLA